MGFYNKWSTLWHQGPIASQIPDFSLSLSPNSLSLIPTLSLSLSLSLTEKDDWCIAGCTRLLSSNYRWWSLPDVRQMSGHTHTHTHTQGRSSKALPWDIAWLYTYNIPSLFTGSPQSSSIPSPPPSPSSLLPPLSLPLLSPGAPLCPTYVPSGITAYRYYSIHPAKRRQVAIS